MLTKKTMCVLTSLAMAIAGTFADTVVPALVELNDIPGDTKILTNAVEYIDSVAGGGGGGSASQITDGTNTIKADLSYTGQNITMTWVVNGIPFVTQKGYISCSYFPENPIAESIGWTLSLDEGSSWEEGYYDLVVGAWFWRNTGTESQPHWEWVADSGGMTGLLPKNATSFDIDGFTGVFPYVQPIVSRLVLTNNVPTKTSQLTNDGTNGVPFTALSDTQVNAIDSVVDGRQTVVVYSNGTTNRLDLVGELSGSDIPNIENATSVRIGSTVTSIGSMAFDSCTSLTSVTIGNGVTIIREDAFYGCTSLTSVMIGNSVMSIVDNAFSRCIGLTSVTIPNSVTNIGDSAFSECIGLTNVIFKGKSLAEVSSMPNYSYWGIDTSIIKTENEATKEWTGDNFLAKTGGVVRGAVTIYGGFAQGCADNSASGFCSHAEGTNTVASERFAHSEGFRTLASGVAAKASGLYSKASGRSSIAIGSNSDASNYVSFVWNGFDRGPSGVFYGSHGPSTFNINPTNGLAGVWIGDTNLQTHISAGMSSKADVSDLSYSMVTPGEWTFSGSGVQPDIEYSVVVDRDVEIEYTLKANGVTISVFNDFTSEGRDVVDFSDENYANPKVDIISTLTGPHLLDRAVNTVSVSSATTLTLPTAVACKARAFRVRLVITAPITSPDKITFVGATTNGVQESISFETENGTFPTLNTISTNILHFTETAPSIFYISNKSVLPAPAP